MKILVVLRTSILPFFLGPGLPVGLIVYSVCMQIHIHMFIERSNVRTFPTNRVHRHCQVVALIVRVDPGAYVNDQMH